MSTLFNSTRGAFRNIGRLSGAWRGAAQANRGRFFSTASQATARRAGLTLGSVATGTALLYGGYQLTRGEGDNWTLFPVLSAAGAGGPQPSVVSETKHHTLFLWIHLKPEANIKQCAKTAAQLQNKIKEVCPPADTDEDDEIIGGVGFGFKFYKKATSNKAKSVLSYPYPHRKGRNGEMPNTDGDIFIHAKSHSRSKLYELCQLLLKSFPEGSIDKAEDVYGWVYKGGRDLSGFIDGTENPAEEDDRMKVAVSKKCGGSYVITQRWVHFFDVIDKETDRTLENWVGRTKLNSIELSNKSVSSHVARIVGTTTPGQKKPFEIVRQSQPYGSVCGERGLFFIGYAAAPDNFEYMLDRMVGADPDGVCDEIMLLSKCVSGNYWYFPSSEKLSQFD